MAVLLLMNDRLQMRKPPDQQRYLPQRPRKTTPKKLRATSTTPTRACTPQFRRAENRSLYHMVVPNQSTGEPSRLNRHGTKLNPLGPPALIGHGGERSIKKPHSETRKNHTSILTSDSSSGKHRVKRRSSYHVNEKGSPMQNQPPQAPKPGDLSGRCVKWSSTRTLNPWSRNGWLLKRDPSLVNTTDPRSYQVWRFLVALASWHCRSVFFQHLFFALKPNCLN